VGVVVATARVGFFFGQSQVICPCSLQLKHRPSLIKVSLSEVDRLGVYSRFTRGALNWFAADTPPAPTAGIVDRVREEVFASY
jgi:hypothetical protein